MSSQNGFPNSPTPAHPLAGNSVEAALTGLLRNHGEGLLSQSGRLKSFLHDECPEARREIGVLIQALEENVPQDLMRVNSGEPVGSLLPRLVERLSEEKSMDRRAADWAVRTWARGLGIDAGIAAPEPLPPSAQRSLPNRPEQESSWLTIDPIPQPQPQTQQIHAIVPVPSKTGPSRTVLLIGAAALLVIGGGLAGWLQSTPVVLPNISEIKVPSPIYVGGKPKTLTVNYVVGSNEAVTLKSHLVDGTGPAPDPSLALAPTPGQKTGTLAVPLPAATKPYKETVEFVVVDAKGNSSAPQRVSYEVLPAPVVKQACSTCGTVLSVVGSEESGISGIAAGVGAAVGGAACSLFGKGKGKVAMSIGCASGGAVAGNAVGNHLKKGYTVTVRFDDGHKQEFKLAEAAGYGKGTRVNLVDGSITPES